MNNYNGRNGNGYQPLPGEGGYSPKPPQDGGTLSIKGWQQENAELQDEVARLRKAAEDWHDLAMRTERENRRLQKFATQRGARMQIMREWLVNCVDINNWDDFAEANPSALKWFDDDGVPVDA